jgi:hypothetical protein
LLYFAISAEMPRARRTSWVTTRLLARSEGRITSPVRRLMLSLMSVTSRPRLDALVTSRRLSSGSSSLHL